MAEGWKSVSAWIRDEHIAQVFQDFSKQDFLSYIGNQFRQNLARSYLRRLYLDYSDFRLLQHKHNKWVIMFQNFRSKWRRAQTWNVVLNVEQIAYWRASLSIHYDEEPFIALPQDEQHWLEWLKSGQERPVSTFIHEKYLSQHRQLIQKEHARYKEAHKHDYEGVNIEKANKKDLYELAFDLDLDCSSTDSKEYIQQLLRQHKAAAAAKKARICQQRTTEDAEQQLKQESSEDEEEQHNQCFGPPFSREEVDAYATKNGLYQDIINTTAGKTPKQMIYTKVTRDRMWKYAETQCKIKGIRRIKGKIQVLRKITDYHFAKHKQNTDIDDNHTNDDAINDDTEHNDNNQVDEKEEILFYQSKKPNPKYSELKYLEQYPLKDKMWFDLDFRLFESRVNRLQHRCECFSGAQLPGECGHTCTCLLLIYFALYDDIEAFLFPTPRERKILNSINDCEYWSKKKDSKWDCLLCQEDDQSKRHELIECDGCKAWYHATCLETTLQKIQEDTATFDIWHCPFCSSHKVWTVRHIP